MRKDLGEFGQERLAEMEKSPTYGEGLADMMTRDQPAPPALEVKWPFKRVLNGHLIVQIDDFGYKGRVVIPDQAKRKPTTGIVVAKADNIEDIEVGDKILFSQFAGYLLKFKGTPIARTIGYAEVLSVLNPDAPDIETEG